MSNRRLARKVAGLAFIIVWTAAGSASGNFVEHLGAEVATSQTCIYPSVVFGFNPLPEPTTNGMVDLTVPQRPTATWSNSGHHYEIIFGFSISAPVAFDTSLMSMPDASGQYLFRFSVPNRNPDTFEMQYDLTTVGGNLDRASWSSFTPQPAPDSFDGKVIGFEFDLVPPDPCLPTEVTLAFQLTDVDTSSVATFVPEPSSALVLILGNCALRCRRRGA